MASLGIEPSTTRTNGSSSPRSALKNHSRKSSAPPTGPHSKSISGQCTAIFGSPGRPPSAISSMLGWVAAVRATESPSQLSPALIHNTWMTVSGGASSVADTVDLPAIAYDPDVGSEPDVDPDPAAPIAQRVFFPPSVGPFGKGRRGVESEAVSAYRIRASDRWWFSRCRRAWD